MEEPGARGTRGTGLRIAPQHLGLMAGSAWVRLLAFHFQLVLAELGSGRWWGGIPCAGLHLGWASLGGRARSLGWKGLNEGERP